MPADSALLRSRTSHPYRTTVAVHPSAAVSKPRREEQTPMGYDNLAGALGACSAARVRRLITAPNLAR
ncbi:hypothetical protein SBBP2_930008 [Burkholderiales bacterium]|nr:hypothetical protein SBBP2_930008 [Burkholderiales bacterium]